MRGVLPALTNNRMNQYGKKTMEVVVLPAGVVTACVLIISIGVAGIFISGLLWILNQIAEDVND